VSSIHEAPTAKEGMPIPAGLTFRLRVLVVLLAVPVLFLTSPETALSHGVGYRQSGKKTVALEFYYSTGETMAYQEARVYSPQDEKNPFQSGRTDESGICSFVPNVEGEWRVAVWDIEGHRVEAVVPVTPEFLNDGDGEAISVPSQSSLPQGAELFIRAALGVSFLFNIAALVRLKCT
jgi:nickel transport protein